MGCFFRVVFIYALAFLSFARSAFSISGMSCLQGQTAGASNTCNLLSAAFPGQVFFPNDQNYSIETKAIWSQEALKSPACVFSPLKSYDLAGGVKILSQQGTYFAVRSGGHMPVPGHNSINEGGIMVATTQFTELTTVGVPNPFGVSYVRGGAAFRWDQMYEFLNSHGLWCIGGRGVGIGSSLLLGGGMSYFSGFRGWAANHIVNVEMVLANSSVIQVNNQTAPDLFWALKGGSNNYGIITRYDLATYDAHLVFGGTVSWAPEDTQKYLDAQTEFILPGGGSEDPKAAVMSNFAYSPIEKQNSSGTTLLYASPDENPKALENFTAIPTTSGSLQVQPLPGIVNGTAGFAPRTHRWSFANIAISASEKTMNMIYKHVVQNADRILGNVSCSVGSATQPVTRNHLQAARDFGGDALDLDPSKGTFVIALIYGEWSDPAYDGKIKEFTDATLASLEREARQENIFYPFVFMNDAGSQQDPIATYGYGTSAQKMKEIARKYDPAEMFQTNVPGFKIAGDVNAC